jgi:hypothetical protein
VGVIASTRVEHLGRVVAAVTSAALAGGLEVVPPEQDVTGGWWEPQLVCAFAGPADPGIFALGLWVELDPVGPVVRLQQYYPGWAEPPEFRRALDRLRAELQAVVPGLRVREGAEAWARRRR